MGDCKVTGGNYRRQGPIALGFISTSASIPPKRLPVAKVLIVILILKTDPGRSDSFHCL